MRLHALIASIAAVLIVSGCGSKGPEPSDTVRTASGLEYRDLVVGTGAIPRKDDTVTIHVRGWLANGRIFQNTTGSDPLEFTIGRNMVMPGWEEGLKTMRVGGCRRLVVPPELAYGATGNPDMGIPANATLIYEITLLSVRRADWITTPSGLMYMDLVTGTGPTPESGQTCYVHYTGWLSDGTQFDSSVGRDPLNFVMGAHRVIAGFEEAVSTMSVGTKRKVMIPPDLAYGSAGSPPSIPPDATLTFEIELLDVEWRY